jgi:hypothetical protein
MAEHGAARVIDVRRPKMLDGEGGRATPGTLLGLGLLLLAFD